MPHRKSGKPDLHVGISCSDDKAGAAYIGSAVFDNADFFRKRSGIGKEICHLPRGLRAVESRFKNNRPNEFVKIGLELSFGVAVKHG